MNEINCYVKVGNNGAIGYIELNRQMALNATSKKMLLHIGKYLSLWDMDNNIKAVIIYSGNDNFCAGGDLKELYYAQQISLAEALSFFKVEYQLNTQIKEFSKPYLALINGVAMGGGLGISVHGSHRVVAEDLCMAMPESAIGFVPDAGSSYFLSRMPDYAGVYMGLTALPIGPQAAMRWGLATHVVPKSKFSIICNDILELNLLQLTKQKLNDFLQGFTQNLTNSNDAVLEHYDGNVFACLDIYNIAQNLANNGAWGKSILARLAELCPLSLNIYLQQYKHALKFNFRECMRMEFNLVQNFLLNGSFIEGIRALLIDKDKCPVWCAEGVELEKFFQASTNMHLYG